MLDQLDLYQDKAALNSAALSFARRGGETNSARPSFCNLLGFLAGTDTRPAGPCHVHTIQPGIVDVVASAGSEESRRPRRETENLTFGSSLKFTYCDGPKKTDGLPATVDHVSIARLRVLVSSYIVVQRQCREDVPDAEGEQRTRDAGHGPWEPLRVDGLRH